MVGFFEAYALTATEPAWASQQALSLDVGSQGYFGKREGASGSVKIKYAF